MYSVCVRDHVMVAHSFRGEVFGPAQALHGATFVVDVEFRRPDLDADNIVVDIGRASQTLRVILADLNYRNLDDVAAFKGLNTTTEFLAKRIFDAMAAAIRSGDLGAGAGAVQSLRVVLHESHIAWAAFEGRLS
jgi:6-pyruvoyl-tetrahydropterin synthase